MVGEVRNCPFCGGEAEVTHMDYDGNSVWGVFCKDDLNEIYPHGHYVDNYATKEEAIEEWNNRYDDNFVDTVYNWAFASLECCDEPEFTLYENIMWDIEDHRRKVARTEKPMNDNEGVGMQELKSDEETCKHVGGIHEVDQFICSSCGIWLEDWSMIEVDEDSQERFEYEYAFKFCPNCGKRIVN